MAVIAPPNLVTAKAVETTGKCMEKTNFPHAENLKELPVHDLEPVSAREFLSSKLEEIKNFTPEQLTATMDENLKHLQDSELNPTGEKVSFREGLTDEEKSRLKEKTGWSDEIVDNIGSIREAEIYQQPDLVEAKIGDKTCLIRQDIDWNQKDQFGRTNAERAKQGLAPLDSNKQPLELHHIGQHNDSPLAELTMLEHRGKGNDTILHNKNKESEIDRQAFSSERTEHWENRIEPVRSESK